MQLLYMPSVAVLGALCGFAVWGVKIGYSRSLGLLCGFLWPLVGFGSVLLSEKARRRVQKGTTPHSGGMGSSENVKHPLTMGGIPPPSP